VGLDPGLPDLLVDGMALDVLEEVPGPDGEGDVGPSVPATRLGGHRPRVVTLHHG